MLLFSPSIGNFGSLSRSHLLAAKETRVYGWRHHDDSCLPASLLEQWQADLYAAIQTFWVDPLHKLKSFHWRCLDGRPPDRTAVVDKDIKLAERLRFSVSENEN